MVLPVGRCVCYEGGSVKKLHRLKLAGAVDGDGSRAIILFSDSKFPSDIHCTATEYLHDPIAVISHEEIELINV